MDQSGQYSDQEIQVLCELRLQSIPGIIVNSALLQNEIQRLPRPINMESILSFVQHLHRTDLPNEQRIFRFDETKMVGVAPTSATVPTTTTTTGAVTNTSQAN
jgi:hypothetical protein